MQTALLSLLAAGGLGVFACGDYTPVFEHEGRAHVAQLGARVATLQGTCHSWGRLTFELELLLPDVEPADLQRDGAAAPSAGPPRAAVMLGWSTASSRARLDATATPGLEFNAAQRLGEPAGQAHVVAMIYDVSGGDAGADFFANLEAEPGDFTWRLGGASDARARVDASFAFSAADAVALRDAALHCRPVRVVPATQ